MLDYLQVKEIIENGVSSDIQKAREYSETLNSHITGKNITKILDKLENYENEKQKELREKLLVSNKGLFSFLLRPIDKVFSAKGGLINYNLTDSKKERLKNFTSNVTDGLDIKTFLRKKVRQQYIIDPNSILLLDIDTDGNVSTQHYPTSSILWYSKTGNQVTSIVFESNKDYKVDEDDTKEYFRVIDEMFDTIYVKDGDNVYELEESKYDNYWGYVPAFILGDEYDPNSNLFLSVIDAVLDEAKVRLRDTSIANVHKLSHGYTKYWQYPEACTQCGGKGTVKAMVEGALTEVPCGSCNGSGVKQHKDPSDLMIIDLPNHDEKPITPHVGGYISPDIDIWEQYNKEQEKYKNEMFEVLWGNPFEKNIRVETATSNILGNQKEADRLGNITTTFSKLHKFILDGYGRFLFLTPEYESSVSYGRRYLLETPNELLKLFQSANEKDAPEVLQKDLIEKYYQTEYADNDLEYLKRKKILAVDPFPFQTAKDVKELGVSNEDLKLKVYYPQWSNQIEEAKLVFMNIDELKSDLLEYVSQKSNINIKNENNVQ